MPQRQYYQNVLHHLASTQKQEVLTTNHHTPELVHPFEGNSQKYHASRAPALGRSRTKKN